MSNTTVTTPKKEPFLPADEIELDIFQCRFCENCIHEKFAHSQDDNDKKCPILDKALLDFYGEREFKYAPKEWVYDDKGKPTCTKFRVWDWYGEDGWNEPTDFDLPYVSLDPNQLSIPFPEPKDEAAA